MKLVEIDGKKYISFKFHELAWSLRTSGVSQYIFDSEGNAIKRFYSCKQAFSVELPKNAKFLLIRYWTNRGNPKHRLYLITDKLEMIEIFTASTTLEDVLALEEKLPKKLIDFLLDDLQLLGED